MTVLPLSREHPVWPSCLYHGYTVYSPVHEVRSTKIKIDRTMFTIFMHNYDVLKICVV